MRRLALTVAVIAALGIVPRLNAQASRAGAAPPVTQPGGDNVTPAEVAAAIDKLGSFDLPVRTTAARTVRRASAAVAVPALQRAAREHADGYTRYRALVLLSGFGESAAADLMRQLIGDRNDRLRMVAYGWFEHHKDPAIVPTLVDALGREQSEFVRPALLRAIAAHGDDPRARTAALPLVLRGQNDFRGALIDALGDYRATYAVPSISDVAKLDGPLQDDAVTALGRIGDLSSHDLLADLQRNGPRTVQPSVAAALILLGSNAAANQDFLKKSLAFGAAGTAQPLLRGASHGLAVLAVRGDGGALTALIDAGVSAKDPARAPIALAIGLVALRNPELLLAQLEPRHDRDGALELLQESFDMLSSEDYELERFYVDVRRQYWGAADGSARRSLAEALIRKLEF
jgi:hypothetical protein